MPEPSSAPPPFPALRRMQFAVAWLDTGKALDQTSLALLVVALCGVIWGPPAPLVLSAFFVSLCCGLTQKIYALRVGFDRRIFALWIAALETACPHPPPHHAFSAELEVFDEALAEMGLAPAATALTQPLARRIQGACRLLRRQAIALALQCACLLFVAGVLLYENGLPLL